MIKLENTEVFNFEGALRGMRNPMNSWDKSDSEYKKWCTCLGENEIPHYCEDCSYDACNPDMGEEVYVVGQNDMNLARKLIKGGSEHRKFLRQIFISVDITAPLYWWKEFDTYKVGTVANSCSTMHKIHFKELELEDFSHEHLLDTTVQETKTDEFMQTYSVDNYDENWKRDMEFIISRLNYARKRFLETKDKRYWWQMIQILPESYNQKRTVTMNYENVYSIYKQRTGHKLDEWHDLNKWCESLPYFKEFFLEG